MSGSATCAWLTTPIHLCIVHVCAESTIYITLTNSCKKHELFLQKWRCYSMVPMPMPWSKHTNNTVKGLRKMCISNYIHLHVFGMRMFEFEICTVHTCMYTYTRWHMHWSARTCTCMCTMYNSDIKRHQIPQQPILYQANNHL